ncbi:MAG: cation:dicarboxylase symporter family transporter [Candidatus Dependentiae bacterium]
MFLKKFSLPFQLIAIIAFVFLCGDFFNESSVRFFYTFSLLFKSVLSLFLPLIIFSFVLTGILSFKRNAPLVLAVLVASIFVSNSVIALLTYLVGVAVVPFVVQGISIDGFQIASGVEPYYQFDFPTLITSENALLIAIVIGIALSFVRIPKLERGIRIFKDAVENFLNYYFIPLLPLYVFGFLLEIHYRGIFASLFSHYGKAFIVILSVQVVFLLAYYFLAASGSTKKMIKYIQNALPSYLTAFSTMSSTTTIPVSVECAEKNMNNKPLAEISMPIMANIHLVGDSISTPLLAMVTVSLFLGTFPDPISYIKFVFFFCTAMLAVSGIPGGGIIVMIPILISQLGFNEQMVSIITALYLLLDPFGTAANVMGDGALVIIVNKVLKKLRVV